MAYQQKLIQILRSGIILPYGRHISSTADVPTGWLRCIGETIGPTGSGATYVGDTYKSLYDIIQNKFGGTYNWAGNNVVYLPDASGFFWRGSDDNKGIDPGDRYALYGGGASGNNPGSYQDDKFKDHSHKIFSADFSTNANSGPMYNYGIIYGSEYLQQTTTEPASGENQESKPINLYVEYIIKI